MPNYRRINISGGTYFFTVVTHNRVTIFNHPEPQVMLRHAIKEVQEKFPFDIEAICLLPDHIHCMWTLPDGDSENPTRWRRIKSLFSRAYVTQFGSRGISSESRNKRGEQAIWQRRFWEHVILDEADYQNHFDYIHFNPVKHGYVSRVCDWPWSSFHRHVKQGVYSIEWGDLSDDTFIGINFGE